MILRVFFFFFELSHSHTKREGNKVAHYLAYLAVNFLDSVIWMENVPPSVFSFIQPDLASFFRIKLIFFSKKKKKKWTPLPKRQNQHVCHLYLSASLFWLVIPTL